MAAMEAALADRSKRKPPAYQTYASDDLASADYYQLTLAERGLLDAMKRVCWVDGSVLAAPSDLALAIRRPEVEVKSPLSPNVLKHFVPHASDSGRLVCPELDRQRSNLDERRKRQQDGAMQTNRARKKPDDGDHRANRDGDRIANRDSKRNGPEKSRNEKNRAESTEDDVPDLTAPHSERSTPEHKEWIGDYEEAEGAKRSRAAELRPSAPTMRVMEF